MDLKERRSSPRKAIKLAAQMDIGNGKTLPCQISDFCAEGLFVRYSSDTSRKLDQVLGSGPVKDLKVCFRSVDGLRRYELYVDIRRRLDGAMGVSFTRPNPEAIDAMLAQVGASRDQDRVSLKAPNDRVQFVLHQCARAVVQHIEPLMDDALLEMIASLKASAQKAGNNQQANELMDSSAQVEARQRVIWHQMAKNLESPLKPAPRGGVSELSVVDKSEFEDWLTLKVMVTKADTQYRGDLLQLKLRLDSLGVPNATGHHNPLGPALVCEAFHSGLSQLRVNREVEKICLRVFDQTVLVNLEPMYRELNNILVRHGVLPDLDLSKYLSEQPAARAEPEPEPESPPGKSSTTAKNDESPESEPENPDAIKTPDRTSRNTSASGKVSRQRFPGQYSSAQFDSHSAAAQTAFATVKSLLNTLTSSRIARGDSEPVTFAPDARELSPGELHTQLQQMQSEAARVNDDTTLRERVVERVKESGKHALGQEQQTTLDVVDRFFGSVGESPRLSDDARERMRALEVPVLKVVMRDPEFFEDRSSPVRGVMDRLAQLGVKGGRINPAVQRRIDELIERINRDFDQDIGVFQDAIGDLDTLIDRQNLVYRRNVERVTAAAEGAQKVAESKRAVARVLDHKLGGRKIPRAVISLLDSGWRDLLSLTWIRQGEESPFWQDYLSVIDSLMAFAEDPQSDVNLPELLRVIQDGLASISSNHMPSSQIRDELKQFLLRSPVEPPEMVEMPVSRAGEKNKKEVSEREQRSLERWTNRARQLRTGDWMRDQDKPDDPQYIRLVWVAREFSRFVFVNHQGMKVVELELEALARHMRKGIIVPDSQYERPLVDESIDRMVKKVYDQLSWASTHDELTGLLGRREFARMLEQQLAIREDERALVRLDLRQFRLLNDTAGYQAGDQALKQVADILRSHVGGGMPLARLAGNEFALLLPAEHALEAAREIVGAIEKTEFNFESGTYHLSASAGLAPELPGLADAERWLKASEDAMKRAKKRGHGKVLEYSLDAHDQARQDQIAAKVASLGDLDEERMLLRCQKMIPLHAHASMAPQYEILISMYDDTGNLITGKDFVRMAERYDRMQAVDRWVVGQVLDWLRDNSPDPARIGGICINLSGHSLNDQSLMEFIYDKLSQEDAPIERLWFEITEASAINDLQSISEFVEEMRELGCRFCLDDFGSGPSSFQFLRSLPVDLIKLDSAFTRELDSNETDRAMVKSMIDMAHYMNREVIASQVENRTVLDMLTSLGADYAQGFVIEKPRLLSSLD